MVESGLSELTLRPDQTPVKRSRRISAVRDSSRDGGGEDESRDEPQDRRGEEDLRSRASERVRRFVHTDVLGRSEQPLLYSDLNEARGEDDDDLDWSGREEIVSQFRRRPSRADYEETNR